MCRKKIELNSVAITRHVLISDTWKDALIPQYSIIQYLIRYNREKWKTEMALNWKVICTVQWWIVRLFPWLLWIIYNKHGNISLLDPDFNPLEYIPRSNSVCNCLRILTLSSIVATPLSVPTNRVQLFSFLHILTNACYFPFFLVVAILLGIILFVFT